MNVYAKQKLKSLRPITASYEYQQGQTISSSGPELLKGALPMENSILVSLHSRVY